MFRLLVIAVIISFLSITGCASARKETRNTQIQQFQMEIARLRSELQQKDTEIDLLEERLQEVPRRQAVYAKQDKGAQGSAMKTPRNIQLALKRANFYNGPADGKVGEKTKKAIKDFQKANGLPADGVVGKETWSKLKPYLNEK